MIDFSRDGLKRRGREINQTCFQTMDVRARICFTRGAESPNFSLHHPSRSRARRWSDEVKWDVIFFFFQSLIDPSRNFSLFFFSEYRQLTIIAFKMIEIRESCAKQSNFGVGKVWKGKSVVVKCYSTKQDAILLRIFNNFTIEKLKFVPKNRILNEME